MNHIYRSIWNDKTGTFVAVPEDTKSAKSAGKPSSPSAGIAAGGARFALKTLAISLMMLFGANVTAQPTGGAVTAGSASIAGGASKVTVNQSSQNVAINWQSFNIGQGEALQFVQPNSHSVALNRVLGSDPSSILGSLSANGKVFLVNPNGILFGVGAQVNVGGLVASTLNISDSDFMAGRYTFSGSGAGNGTIRNQGAINADGGYVALLGANVSNDGVIVANLGSVALAAGNAITLDVAGDGLLNVTVNQGAVNALVQNGGLIRADGGQVLLTAQAAGSLLQTVVNNTGIIEAQTIENRNGSIKLLGDMQSGTVKVSGKLDASAPNGGDGGFIETSAAHVKVADNTIISTKSAYGKTGTWLLDPVNWTIAALGDETPANVVTSLALTDRTILATNDITVAEVLTWATPQTLTLNAGHDVLVNAAMTASTAGSGITLIAGNDVLATAAITASALGAKIDMSAGRNVSVTVVTASAGGSVNLRANQDVIVNGAITADTGLDAVILRADSDGSGPGVAGGTVIFAGAGAVTTPRTIIRFNPASYDQTATEIANYAPKVSAILDAKAWVFAQGNNKVYDGNTDATLSFKGDPTLGGAVTLNAGAATFTDSKNVGTGKPVAFNGYTLGGANSGRFDLFAPVGSAAGSGTTTANITQRPLTATATAFDKDYDGNTTAIPVPTLAVNPANLVAGETVTATGTGAFNSPNVATANLVTVNSTTLVDGSGLAGNYSLAVGQTAPAIIRPIPLSITANSDSRAYNGLAYSGGNGVAYSGFVNSETAAVLGGALAYSGTSQGAINAGSYVITPGGLTSGNYAISYSNGALTITPAAAPPPPPPPPVVVPPVIPPVVAVVAVVTPPFSPPPVVVEPEPLSVEILSVEPAPVAAAPETTPFSPALAVMAPEPATVAEQPVATLSGDTLSGMIPGDTVDSAPLIQNSVGKVPRGGLGGLNLTVIDDGVRMPPVLVVRAPPTPLVPVMVPVEVAQIPPAPVVDPAVMAPNIYVPPLYLRKQDRN